METMKNLVENNDYPNRMKNDVTYAYYEVTMAIFVENCFLGLPIDFSS